MNAKAYADNGTLMAGGADLYGGSNTSTTRYPLAWAPSTLGGVYAVSHSEITYIHVADNVASIWLGVYTTTTTNGITSLTMFYPGNEARPHSSPGYGLVSDGTYFDSDTQDLHASAQPIGGVFDNGTRIWSTNTDNGAALGWVVVGRRTTTASAGEPAAEDNVALTSIVGMDNNDIMGVVITQDNSLIQKWHWTTINGTPSVGVARMTHAVPAGWTIANGAKVITYRLKSMPNIGS